MISLNRIILLGLCITLTGAANWGYVGESGPLNWATLFPEACSGRYQSPIDISTQNTVYNPQLKDFAIFYDPPAPGSRFYVHNNGHSIQVNTEGKFFVSNGGLQNIYSTAQFHFHWGHKSHHGSEHTVDGKAAPIEMHIVNWNSDVYRSISEAATEPEGLSVLGILFEVSAEDNPSLEPLVQVLTNVRDPDMKIKAEIPAVSMRTFLPANPSMYYRYNGSLTTPGCFESVIWTVFRNKQTISRRQLAVFRQVLKPKHHKKHKRSTHHQRNVERAVLLELGIKDNNMEKARFRRTLEEKKAVAAETVVEEEIKMMENVSEKQDAHHHTGNSNSGHQDTPTPKPVQINANGHGPDYKINNSKNTYEEKVRQMLVNNFRPVQPLNGRTIYRSFPFFDEPITSNTRIVYIERDELTGMAQAVQASFISLVCSFIAYKAAH